MDQILLSSLLQKLVIDNEKVCLPGMGSFVAEEIPSVFLDGGKGITPPGRRILFKSSLMLNDGLLETEYAAAKELPLPQAREMLMEEIAGLRGELEEKEEAELPGFGVFRKREAGQYFFVTDRNFVAAPDSYGLETLTLKIKTEPAATEEENRDIENIPKKDESGTVDRTSGEPYAEGEDIPEREDSGDTSVETPPADSLSGEAASGEEKNPEPENSLPNQEAVGGPVSKQAETREEKRKKTRIWTTVLWIVGILVIAILLVYIFRDSLRPLLEKILYSREELDILHRSGL